MLAEVRFFPPDKKTRLLNYLLNLRSESDLMDSERTWTNESGLPKADIEECKSQEIRNLPNKFVLYF